MTHYSSLSLKAPAKINWFLNIIGLRDDGFHEIRTLMQKISLCDMLTFAPSKDIVVRTDAGIPFEQNLVYKAAMLLKGIYGVDRGADIQLEKNIPAGAGLGGGSSDAAAALRGLNKLWELGLSTEELCKAAAQLGSDVPFFLHGPLCLAGGRGEKVTPCNAGAAVSILLVKPHFNISTAWAYGEYKKRIHNAEHGARTTSPLSEREWPDLPRKSGTSFELTKKTSKVDNIRLLIHRLESLEFREIKDILSNDLESVAIKSFPVIAEIKKRLVEHGSEFSLMSGSGSTVFGVFNSSEKAERAAEGFKDYRTAVVQTITD